MAFVIESFPVPMANGKFNFGFVITNSMDDSKVTVALGDTPYVKADFEGPKVFGKKDPRQQIHVLINAEEALGEKASMAEGQGEYELASTLYLCCRNILSEINRIQGEIIENLNRAFRGLV